MGGYQLMKLSNQLALVTGAGRGIGKAISLALASEGATVVLVSRTESELQSVRMEIVGKGAKAHIVRADITKEDQVEKLFLEIKNQFGRLDILVNNAGIGKFVPVKSMKVADFDAMWNLNMRGIFLCTQQAIPLMEQQRSGTIVNISSLAGKNAFVNGAGYAATKWALMGFSKCLMLEERQYNIRVVTICPGSVDTSFNNQERESFHADKLLSPADVAETVVCALTAHPRAMVSEIDIRPTNPK
jgi:3-oxoacyl-[acyl-carrier protein] reductase